MPLRLVIDTNVFVSALVSPAGKPASVLNLVLEGRVEKRMLGLRRQVAVEAVCSKYLVEVEEPHVGCGHCHEERAAAQILEGREP